jgi:hypothetical protein
MAHLKIGVNTETGEVVISASKKVKETLAEAISKLEDAGYSTEAANAALSALTPLNMESSERSSEEVEGEDEDIIFVTTFEASAGILNLAIAESLTEILGVSIEDEDEDEDEDDDGSDSEPY